VVQGRGDDDAISRIGVERRWKRDRTNSDGVVDGNVAPELDKLNDNTPIDVQALKQQSLRLVDLIFEQHWKETVDWFLEVADDRVRWRQMPPFLR
jgi:hypothetical protein